MISFIIPAHNEEALVGRTIESIRAGVAATGRAFEIILVDDASTDRTGEVGRQHGARVLSVELRKISAVRNAGARQAQGEILIFVDADTVLSAENIAEALRALEAGAIGGGALVVFDERMSLWARFLVGLWNSISRLRRWAAGCFIFVRRDVFESVGGFDENYYCAEEIILSSALKRKGRFVILTAPVVTSSRKAHAHGMLEMLWLMLRLARPGAWRRREGLDMWYKRRDVGRPADDPAAVADRGERGGRGGKESMSDR